MPIEFEVIDPRGRRIVCSQDTWRNHVSKKRPWMSTPEWIEAVKKTLQEPLVYIYQDANFPNRHVYYRKQTNRTWYMKVIVEFKNEESIGELIAATPANSGKTGEKPIWP
jgi:hypothetical protein